MTVYVVGLDGAEWSLLRPWMDEGRLPALADLVADGVAGDLESTLPPVTFPAWKCYSTGKTPGKLGVYEWFSLDRGGPDIRANDATTFRSREYWEVLAEAGVRPAVVNMPTTHPPSTDDGVLTVAGSPASERGMFTSPENLKADLLDAVPEYRVKPDLVLDEAPPDELVSEARALVDQRFDAATWLASERDRDLVHLTVFVTDTVQHRLWDRPERIAAVYERVDERLAALRERDDCEGVVVMSDHGFTGIGEIFMVNQWLADRGDLVLGDDAARGALASLGLTRERLKRVVDRLGLVNAAQALVPESVQRFFPSQTGRTAIQDAPIDWANTDAVSLGRGPIYLTGDDPETTARELDDALRTLETPRGDPVVADVHDPTDIYTGEMVDAPDLIVEYAEGVDAPEAVGGDVFGEQTEWLATHRRTGVFAAAGDQFEAGGDCSLTLYDLAPTLLHLLDVPVPEDVDGDVRLDLLAGEAADRDVRTGPPTGVDVDRGQVGDEVEDTLRNLGYME